MGDLLKDLAPTLVSFFGTPAAGAATKLLIDAFDGDKAKVDEIVSGRNPISSEDAAKIRIAEIAAQARREELEFERTKLDYDNVNSARDMQKVALQQDDWFAKNFVYLLATFWSITSMAYIAAVTFITIPESNIRFADSLTGFMTASTIAIILNFFFGTSLSSRNKTEILASKR